MSKILRTPLRLAIVCLVLTILAFFTSAFVAALGRIHFITPSPTPLFEDRDGNFLTDHPMESENLGYWEIDGPIPERISNAVLTAEDKRFYKHLGVDFRSLIRALWRNIFRGERQGGSTIAMQVSRLQHPSKRNIWNKSVEIFNALFLTLRFGRESVLRQYLQLLPQGNNIRGVVYAARRYFKKPLIDLSWAEAALLAGLPKAPGNMNLFLPDGMRVARERARIILTLLEEEHFIDEAALQTAFHQLYSLPSLHRENRPRSSTHFILRLLEEYGNAPSEQISRPYRTFLDPTLQIHIQELASAAMNKWRDYGAGNIAVVVAEKQSGGIVGYLGSDNYFNEFDKGAINYATVLRSSGSCLKPFLYAQGIELGYFSPASLLADLPMHLVSEKGEFTVRNFDENYLGPMLYGRALANSRNIPAVRVLERIGVVDHYSLLDRLGFLRDKQYSAFHYGYGLTLGGLYVTLEDMVAAYGVLARGGLQFALRWLKSGADTSDLERERIFSSYASSEIGRFLSDPLSRLPSFPRLTGLEVPVPAAIKTGTSDGFRDAWAAAYTNRYIASVWIGHPDNETMNHVPGMVAAGIVRDILIFLHPEESRGVNEHPFPPPSDATPVVICTLSGKIATVNCTLQITEYFLDHNQPRTLCDVHLPYTVNRITGTIADSDTPPALLETRVFTILAPEYSAWGTTRGFGAPPAQAMGDRRASLDILSPVNGGRVVIDNEIPLRYQSIPLRAEVIPAVNLIWWYVNGEPFAAVGYPYEARWPVLEGQHSFQIRFPDAEVRSDVITITVTAD